MKANWLLASAVVVIASCEKPAPLIAEKPERKLPSPPKIEDTPSPAPQSPAPEKPASPVPNSAGSPSLPPPPEDPIPPQNPAPPSPQHAAAPAAEAVPDKPGFVFSPYNNKIIDVREMPSGMLVSDPTFRPSEKKFFRVP